MLAQRKASEVEREGWHRYLVRLDREELSGSIARPDTANKSFAGREKKSGNLSTNKATYIVPPTVSGLSFTNCFKPFDD